MTASPTPAVRALGCELAARSQEALLGLQWEGEGWWGLCEGWTGLRLKPAVGYKWWWDAAAGLPPPLLRARARASDRASDGRPDCGPAAGLCL